jgi:hypothetical protein
MLGIEIIDGRVGGYSANTPAKQRCSHRHGVNGHAYQGATKRRTPHLPMALVKPAVAGSLLPPDSLFSPVRTLLSHGQSLHDSAF